MTTAIMVVEACALGLLTLLVAGLLRSHAEILRRLHEMGAGLDSHAGGDPSSHAVAIDLRPPVGGGFAASADVAGAGLDEGVLHVAITGVAHHTLLAFLSSGCLTCRTFWDAFADPRALDLPDDVRLVVVTKDAAEERVSELRKVAPDRLPVVMSSAAWNDYHVPGSPYFVLVDGLAGRVRGEGTGAHWEQVQNLLRQASDDLPPDGRGGGRDAREARIDRELLAYGIAPGDPSLFRTAGQIARDSRP